MKVGFHILRVGRGDSVNAVGQEVIELSSDIKQDAFIDQSHDGFISAIEDKLAMFGHGKLPKQFILVLAERLENAIASTCGGIIDYKLNEILSRNNRNSYDESGRGYEEAQTDYLPIIYCELGESNSFKRYAWGSEQKHAAQPNYPVSIVMADEFQQLKEYVALIHANNITH